MSAAWCSLLWALEALNKLVGSSAQYCSTASRQGSGSSTRDTALDCAILQQQNNNMPAPIPINDAAAAEEEAAGAAVAAAAAEEEAAAAAAAVAAAAAAALASGQGHAMATAQHSRLQRWGRQLL
jgi:hypothetical protein